MPGWNQLIPWDSAEECLEKEQWKGWTSWRPGEFSALLKVGGVG